MTLTSDQKKFLRGRIEEFEFNMNPNFTNIKVTNIRYNKTDGKVTANVRLYTTNDNSYEQLNDCFYEIDSLNINSNNKRLAGL